MKELTIREVAKLIGRDRSNILRWIKQNRFPNAKLKQTQLGEYWVIPQSDLENFEIPNPGPKPSKKK